MPLANGNITSTCMCRCTHIILHFVVPPCRHKCCKVRFKTTIEVRERTGGDCQRTSLLAQGDRPIKPLSIWKVMGVAFIFGILVGDLLGCCIGWYGVVKV